MNRKHNPWVALVALILLATILVMTCAGCHTATTEVAIIKNSDRFTTVRYFNGDAHDCYIIITDNETGVRYLYVDGYNSGGLTVLQEGEG